MTAQAVPPPLPPDPAPTPPAAPASGGGKQFLAVLGGKAASGGSAAVATPVPAGKPTASVPASKVGGLARVATNAGRQSDSASQAGDNDPAKKSDAAAALSAVPVPIFIPLQQTLTSPTAVAPAAALTSAPPTPGNLTSLPAAIAAAASQTTPPSASGGASISLPVPPVPAASTAGATAGATQVTALDSATATTASLPASATPASAANSPAGSAASPGTAAALPADPTSGNPPPLSATINARLAAGAAVLISQPRAALASIAPDASKTAAKPGAGDAALPVNARQLAAANDAARDSAKLPAATPAAAEQPTSNSKDGATLSTTLGTHDPAANEQQQATQAVDNSLGANNPTTPQATPAAPVTAPPPSDLPPPTTTAVPHAVAEQVAINVHQAVKSGVDHIQIQLQPADLGAIDVKLNVNHDGRVTVVVSADRGDTLNLLQQDAGGLAQALRNAGLQADNSSLSFNLRGGFQFQQQQSAPSGAFAGESAYTSDADEVIAAAPASFRRHAGSLDIHV